MSFLAYCRVEGVVLELKGRTLAASSPVWPVELPCAADELTEQNRALLEAQLCEGLDPNLDGPAGVTIAGAGSAAMDRGAAEQRAIENELAELRRWGHGGEPIVHDCWEGKHAWAFMVSTGNMDMHGQIVDKYSGRCFARLCGDMVQVFGW